MNFTAETIRQYLAKKYDGDNYPASKDRSLFIHKSYCAYQGLGAVYFSLNGSPPKGYAIYIPDHRVVRFYDLLGRPFKPHIGGTRDVLGQGFDFVSGLEQFQDNDIILGDDISPEFAIRLRSNIPKTTEITGGKP